MKKIREEQRKRIPVPEELRVSFERDAAVILGKVVMLYGRSGEGGRKEPGEPGDGTGENGWNSGIRENGWFDRSGQRERRGRNSPEFRMDKTMFAGRIIDWLESVRFLPGAYVKMLLREENPVSAMWTCYRQNPVLDCRTSSEIEEILEDMRCYRKIFLAA